MINAAIVGVGRWGQNLVRSVQGVSTRLRFVRGVARRPDAVREFAVQQGLELSSRLDEALADPRVDAVVLATPHTLHVEQVVAAARAGKPVCCEKPLALDRAGAERAVAACRDAGVVLATGQESATGPPCASSRKWSRAAAWAISSTWRAISATRPRRSFPSRGVNRRRSRRAPA